MRNPERKFTRIKMREPALVIDQQERETGNMLLALMLAVYGTEAEGDLVRRLQRREQDALEELYDRYGKIVYSLILRIVKDAAIAEDLVQETFLRVWNRVQGFDARKGSIDPWLIAVARNRAINY